MKNSDDDTKCLFVLWNTALKREKQLIDKISETHDILSIVDGFWDLASCRTNFLAFYSDYLPNLDNKIAECGIGEFKIIITKPKSVETELVLFKKNMLVCYSGVINLKNTLREIAGGLHNVHISNNKEEFRKDYSYFFNEKSAHALSEVNNRAFHSLSEFLCAVSEFNKTVVLRVPSLDISQIDTEHEDIDLLVIDRKSFAKYFGLTQICDYPENKRFCRRVGGIVLYIDLHTPDDNDIDPRWCWDIIDRATDSSGINTISAKDALYLELYRFMFLKKSYPLEDLDRALFNFPIKLEYGELKLQLKRFLLEQNYRIVTPKDPKTYFALYRKIGSGWEVPFYTNYKFYSRKHVRVKIAIFKDFFLSLIRYILR